MNSCFYYFDFTVWLNLDSFMELKEVSEAILKNILFWLFSPASVQTPQSGTVFGHWPLVHTSRGLLSLEPIKLKYREQSHAPHWKRHKCVFDFIFRQGVFYENFLDFICGYIHHKCKILNLRLFCIYWNHSWYIHPSYLKHL